MSLFLSTEQLACFDPLCPPSEQTCCPGGTQPCCPQQGQGTAAFKVASLQPAGENQFLCSRQENIALSQEKPAALPPSQFFGFFGVFFVVKGCCDSVARTPQLLFFPSAPTQKFPRHWEQWPSSSTPRGFEGIHQEDGFMPLPLLPPAIWFSSHLCSGAAKAPSGRLQAGNNKPGRCTGSSGQSSTHVPIFCLPLAQGHREGCGFSHLRRMEPPQAPRMGNFPVPKRVWILSHARS